MNLFTGLVSISFKLMCHACNSVETGTVNLSKQYNSSVIKVYALPDGWVFHYPGADNKFGAVNFNKVNKKIDFITGEIDAEDDFTKQDTLFLTANNNVSLQITSYDSLHTVNLSHFNMQIDAMPGINTTLHFNPVFTTEEMRKRTGNSLFNYTFNCSDSNCNNKNLSKAIIIVH